MIFLKYNSAIPFILDFYILFTFFLFGYISKYFMLLFLFGNHLATLLLKFAYNY